MIPSFPFLKVTEKRRHTPTYSPVLSPSLVSVPRANENHGTNWLYSPASQRFLEPKIGEHRYHKASEDAPR